MKKVIAIGVVLIATILASSSADAQTVNLTKKNTLVLSSQVDDASVAKLIQEAKALDSESKSKDPIYLFLYTPGGSIQAGMELIESLKTLNRPVHTISLFSASMGFQIAQNLGMRYILSSGVLMSHEAYGGFEGAFSHGKSQIDSVYGLWLNRILEMDLQTVARTKGKQTLESYRKAYSKDLWLTGAQAVKGGYADQVVKVRCDVSMSGFKEEIVYFMGMALKVKFSECPMNTAPLSIEAMVRSNKGLIDLTQFLTKGGSTIGQYDTPPSDKEALYTKDVLDIPNITSIIDKYKKQREEKSRNVIRY